MPLTKNMEYLLKSFEIKISDRCIVRLEPVYTQGILLKFLIVNCSLLGDRSVDPSNSSVDFGGTVWSSQINQFFSATLW